MSFGYNINIPFSTHNPSNDQPLMEENFNSINSWVGVDHVGFNNASGGQHEQVTFNSNNPPSGTVTPPILFTNNQDGFGTNLPGSLAQLFFYSGANTKGQQQYEISGSSGSVLLNMGIILKWVQQAGVATTGGTTNTFTSFGLEPFPNNLFTVLVTNTNTGTLHSVSISNWLPASFVAKCDSSTVGFGFIALGN
jgi:hypothetical protein